MATKRGTTKRATGSQKLAATGGKVNAKSSLAAAVAALDRAGLNHNILTRGIPIPDVITGTLRARTPKELGAALETLFKVPNVVYKPVKLFPKGIPVIDIIEVQIEGRIQTR
jgi:hypothetical protein